jgi:FkbM family methyltransferase
MIVKFSKRFLNMMKTKILTNTPDKYNLISVIYILFLSRVSTGLNSKASIKGIYKFNKFKYKSLIEIVDKSGNRIYTQNFGRSNRFISGFDHAFDRIWDQYLVTNFEFQNSKPIVIDIGANIGEFVIAAAQRHAHKIYAFEPDPVCFLCLESNTKSIFEKVNLYNFPLSNKTEIQKFYLATENADSSLVPPTTSSKSTDLMVKRLDVIREIQELNYIDLLKMDAEGAEPEVLEGLGDLVYKIGKFVIDVGPERNGKSTDKMVMNFFANKKIRSEFRVHKSGRTLVHAGGSL